MKREGRSYDEVKAYSRGYAAGRKLRGPVLAREIVRRLGLLSNGDLRRVEIAIRDAIYEQFGTLHTGGTFAAAEAAIESISLTMATEASASPNPDGER